MDMQPYHLLVGSGMALIIGVLCLVWGDRPDLAEHIRRLFADRPVRNMSSKETDDRVEGGTAVVHVPVLRTGTEAGTSQVVLDEGDADLADTTAAETGTGDWSVPRISTRLSDDNLVVMLAAQRGPQGKWRFSANKIHDLVGGSRAAVLAQVKEIQQGTPPAQFRPLTDEQQTAREQLGLPPR
jgi:hypothetical protein